MSGAAHDGDVDEALEGEVADRHAVSALLSRLAGDHAALARRVTDVEGHVEDLASAFDEIEATLGTGHLAGDVAPTAPNPTPSPTPHAAPVDEPIDEAGTEVGLDMRRLVAWVRDNVALLLERKVPQTGGQPYWCRKWWLHPEAIARFEAARRSWAEAVVAAGGNAMVVYFEHLDHQLGVLCGENGPFCGCTGGAHRDSTGVKPLGHDEPDESYFIEFEQARDS